MVPARIAYGAALLDTTSARAGAGAAANEGKEQRLPVGLVAFPVTQAPGVHGLPDFGAAQGRHRRIIPGEIAAASHSTQPAMRERRCQGGFANGLGNGRQEDGILRFAWLPSLPWLLPVI